MNVEKKYKSVFLKGIIKMLYYNVIYLVYISPYFITFKTDMLKMFQLHLKLFLKKGSYASNKAKKRF